MDITVDQNSLALFLTVLIAMLTLVAKQWHADRKIFRILETMQARQETFYSTVETFKQCMQQSSTEHAVLLERLANIPKEQ